MRALCCALALTSTAIRAAAPAAVGDVRLPFLRIPQAAVPPTVDGTVRDAEWARAARVTNFVRTDSGALAQEQTTLWLTYSQTHLLLAFRMKAFCLDPVSNMGGAFKAKIKSRDAPVWDDDAVEFRLERQGAGPRFNYYFAFNANAALLDMLDNGSWDRAWDSGTLVRARRDAAGFWEAEVAVPFADLNGDAAEGATWRFICTRFEHRLGENTSWARLVHGDHTNSANAGYLVLGGGCPAVRAAPLDEQSMAKGAAPCGVRTPTPAEITWRTGLHQQGELRFTRQGAVACTAAETSFEAGVDAARIRRGGGDHFQLCVTEPQTGLLYRSGKLPLPAGSAQATFTARATAPLEIHWNGRRVTADVSSADALPLELQPGANVLAVLAPAEAKLSGLLECAGERFPIGAGWRAAVDPADGWATLACDDGAWAPAQTTTDVSLLEGCPAAQAPASAADARSVVFRKTILNRATVLYPICSDNVWHLSANGTYALHWNGMGAAGWNLDRPLKDFRLLIEIPEGLELLGVAGRKPDGRPNSYWGVPPTYRWAEDGAATRDGRRFRRYAVTRNAPVELMEYNSAWGKRTRRKIHGCSIFVRAGAQASDELLPLYYYCTAQQEAVREIPNTLFCRVLPELDGRQPRNTVLFLVIHDRELVIDDKLYRPYLETIRRAGVTEIWGDCSSNLPRELGLKQSFFFNFRGASDPFFQPTNADVEPLLAAFPEAQAITFHGRKKATICLSYVARHPETWPELEKQVRRIKAENPSLTHLFWDYEFSPFPKKRGHSFHPCFSKSGIATFARLHGIDETLTPQLLREKYEKKWVEFACGELATVCGVLRDACHKHGLKMTMYSGYECDDTHWRYGVNWNLVGPNLDIGYCGYGRSPERIAATRKGLGGKPLVGGLLTMGEKAQHHEPAHLVRKVVDCGGGVLCWYEARWDARALASIARASKLIAAVEPFLTHGTRCDSEVIVGGIAPDNVVVYTHEGRILILVLNAHADPQSAGLWLRRPGAALTDLDTRTQHDPSKCVRVTVPGGDVTVLQGPLGAESRTFGGGPSLIKNGSFEEAGAGGTLKGWGPVYGGYTSVDTARSGGKALSLSCAEAPADEKSSRRGATQVFSGFRPGSTLLLSSHVYVEKLVSGHVMPIYLSLTSRGKTRHPHVNLFPGQVEPGEWRRFEFVLDLSAYPDVTSVCFWCLGWNSGPKPFVGTVHYDDIAVTPLE